MALSFFISLFVTYTDIANRQTTNIFFGFLGIHSSDAREKKREKRKKEKKKKKEKKGIMYCRSRWFVHAGLVLGDNLRLSFSDLPR